MHLLHGASLHMCVLCVLGVVGAWLGACAAGSWRVLQPSRPGIHISLRTFTLVPQPSQALHAAGVLIECIPLHGSLSLH